MSDTSIAELWSPELSKVMERAREYPQMRMSSLAHLIDASALKRAFLRLRKDAAIGIDGITVETYGADLEANVQDLRARMRAWKYRHQPILRVHIPKENGKTRPLGISSTEDKVVQGALTEILEAVYEPLFYEHSYGFRKGRGAHHALRALDKVLLSDVTWVLEADIVSFFDSIDRKMLLELLRNRITDGSFLRLVGKCLHVGVLEGEEYTEPGDGTPQGSIISPMLGNIYLHYVLDEWFEREVRPRLQGAAYLVRYADDFVMGFELEADAHRVREVIEKRMARFGLTLHPEKTRLIPFQRPTGEDGNSPGTFDFLGFTHYWKKTKEGKWMPGMKTRKARQQRALARIIEACRKNRHLPVSEQHAMLRRKLLGHYNYFGVNGNMLSLRKVHHYTKRAWQKWLNRRSQKSSMPWKRFNMLLERFPLPEPVIRVQIWALVP